MASNGNVPPPFRLVPYRDTATRVAVQQTAESSVIKAFIDAGYGTPRVRQGYWYDMQKNGGTAYNGSNEIEFASGSNSEGFPDMVVLPITIPPGVAWSIYGIADYTAQPSLQAMKITQNDAIYPLIFLAPDIYTNEDHKAILNGNLPAIIATGSLSITLYGTAATTDHIDMLFEIAERNAGSS